MYHIDTSRIKRQLLYLQTCLNVLQDVERGSLERVTEQFAAARALHVAIECITDIGNALIDGFIMRDPGSYDDIIEILKDEQVIPAQEASQLKRLVAHRKILVLNYTEIDKKMLQYLIELGQALKPFASRIESYLKQELGPNGLTFYT